MKETKTEILEQLKSNLGEKVFKEYLKLKELHCSSEFQVKAWLNEEAIEAGEYENIELGVSFEDALLSATEAIKNDEYICSEIISKDSDELDYIFEAMIVNNVFKCNFTPKAWVI